MKITDDGKLSIGTTKGHVQITIGEGLDQCIGECLIIDASDVFVHLTKLKDTKIFKLMIYPSKRERTKAHRKWYKFIKNLPNEKDILEANERASKDWQVLAEAGTL